MVSLCGIPVAQSWTSICARLFSNTTERLLRADVPSLRARLPVSTRESNTFSMRTPVDSCSRCVTWSSRGMSKTTAPQQPPRALVCGGVSDADGAVGAAGADLDEAADDQFFLAGGVLHRQADRAGEDVALHPRRDVVGDTQARPGARRGLLPPRAPAGAPSGRR